LQHPAAAERLPAAEPAGNARRSPVSAPAAAAAAGRVWSVAALLLATADALAARFGAVAVRGELSGYTRAASGHCYFALKDDGGSTALLRCAMFRRAAALLDFAPADGQRVELRGRVGVYEPRGELQMVVESMQRLGAGTLYEEFLRQRARLEAQGLFDPARKRALPPHPAALGIVTSPAAAALHDVLTTLARRAPHMRVVLYPTPVQGAEAPAAIVAALAVATARREVDLLLLVRGGGSIEDLWSFNDERVVRAVAASPLPVVCGVGHETDLTLADLAADLRAPTPTAAAELAAPAREETLAALEARRLALGRALERGLQRATQRVDLLAARLGSPARRLEREAQHVEALGHRLAQALRPLLEARARALEFTSLRLARAAALRLQARQGQLEALAARLDAVDPRRVLARGYAWVEDAAGRPVVSVRGLHAGQQVRAVWADGHAQAEVVEVEPHETLPGDGDMGAA
jgi:exodeoxyribonuclease VII large subunit